LRGTQRAWVTEHGACRETDDVRGQPAGTDRCRSNRIPGNRSLEILRPRQLRALGNWSAELSTWRRYRLEEPRR
jgi:hypothetical protein